MQAVSQVIVAFSDRTQSSQVLVRSGTACYFIPAVNVYIPKRGV